MVGENFFCFLPIVPVRAEAKDEAEMVTQLLFGEVGEILEFNSPWLKIKSAHDGYEGFIDFKQILTISDEAKLLWLKQSKRQYANLVTINSEFGPIQTVKGAFFNENETQFKVDDYSFSIINKSNSSIKHANIGELSMEYINAPYLWGGRTLFGIDCSGFTQSVLRFYGIELYRDASEQVKQGNSVSFGEHKVGDLAFFTNSKGRVTHVGIILENEKIIHASGRVKIDKLTAEGIYSSELKKKTHELSHIKRYLN